MKLLILLLPALLYSCTKLPAPKEGADLTPESRTIAVGGIERIALEPGWKLEAADRNILSVDPPSEEQKRWTILAIKKGRGILFFTDPQGHPVKRITYEVITNGLAEKLAVVRHLLSDVPGIWVEAFDDQIVIRGNPSRASDGEKILQVQAAYVDHILNLAVDSQRLCETRFCKHEVPPEYAALSDIPLEGALDNSGCKPGDDICDTVKAATDAILMEKKGKKTKH